MATAAQSLPDCAFSLASGGDPLSPLTPTCLPSSLYVYACVRASCAVCRRSCAILAKQPRLLRTPPAALQQQLRMLQLGLQMDGRSLGEVILRQPGLLFDPPQDVRVRAQQLAARMEVPVAMLLRCVGACTRCWRGGGNAVWRGGCAA